MYRAFRRGDDRWRQGAGDGCRNGLTVPRFEGRVPRDNNVLKHAPHTAETVTATFWPAVGRIDDAYGDRHLVCTCPTLEVIQRKGPGYFS